MITVEDVLKAFGGAPALAEILNISPQAVWNIKMRGTIPAAHWATLANEAKARLDRTDVTPDQIEILSTLTLEAFAATLAARQAKAS